MAVVTDALRVAQQYAVFPVRIKKDGGKVPALSNLALSRIYKKQLQQGQGGYKAASKDPEIVKAMFKDAGEYVEIGVPMKPNGLVCLDFDVYKGGEARAWVVKHNHLIENARLHRTGSGGLHAIFLDPGVKLPGQVAGLPDAEVKSNGFIVWPREGGGYGVTQDVEPPEMPQALIDAVCAGVAGAGGQTASAGQYHPNDVTDEELRRRILQGEDYHNALATLAMRFARSEHNAEKVFDLLQMLVGQSQPTTEERKRRRSTLLWEGEGGELWRLAEGAVEKNEPIDASEDAEAILGDGPAFVQLAKHEGRRPEPPQEVPAQSALEQLESVQIEPRQWLHGHYLIKGHMTMTSAPGGMGKSTAVMTEMLEIASQKNITGQRLWRPANVLYLNGEDPLDELQRRIAATMRYHGLKAKDLEERFDFHSGRDLDLVLVEREDGELVQRKTAVDLLRDLIEARGAEVICLDPLSSFHRGNENSNEEMNQLLAVLRKLSHELEVSFHLVHHSVKDALVPSSRAGGAEQSRGASAFLDACRVVRTMRLMTQQEREDYDLPEGAERNHVVVSVGKGNLVKERTGYTFELDSYKLGNGNETYPDGDSVGVIRLFDKPRIKVTDEIDDLGNQAAAARILVCLPTDQRAAWAGRGPKKKAWAGFYLLKRLGRDPDGERDQQFAQALLERFVEDGLLRKVVVKNARAGRDETNYQPITDALERMAAVSADIPRS